MSFCQSVCHGILVNRLFDSPILYQSYGLLLQRDQVNFVGVRFYRIVLKYSLLLAVFPRNLLDPL